MKTAIERFNSKWKADANGCHVWQARKTKAGYGRFYANGKCHMAHRWALRFIKGVELIEGLQCDHLCNNPSCVNPAHLRQCTARENLMAQHSKTRARINIEATHCSRGHEFSGYNLKFQSSGARQCRTCFNMNALKWYHAHRPRSATP